MSETTFGDMRKACLEALMVDLRTYQRQFENYMTWSRWDTCKDGGMYADDGMLAIDMFLEFIETRHVTDDDGKELEA